METHMINYINLNLLKATVFHNINCNYINIKGTVEKLLHICFCVTKYNDYVCILNTMFSPLTLLRVFKYLLFEYEVIWGIIQQNYAKMSHHGLERTPLFWSHNVVTVWLSARIWHKWTSSHCYAMFFIRKRYVCLQMYKVCDFSSALKMPKEVCTLQRLGASLWNLVFCYLMQEVEHIGKRGMSVRIYCLLIWKQDYTVFPVSRYHDYLVQYHSSASQYNTLLSVFCNSTFGPMPCLWHGKMHNGSDKTLKNEKKYKQTNKTNGAEEKKKTTTPKKKRPKATVQLLKLKHFKWIETWRGRKDSPDPYR